jgi:hypothetical protein
METHEHADLYHRMGALDRALEKVERQMEGFYVERERLLGRLRELDRAMEGCHEQRAGLYLRRAALECRLSGLVAAGERHG